MTNIILLLIAFVCLDPLFGQTIEEKKAASIQKTEGSDVQLDVLLRKINQESVSLRSELGECYSKVLELQGKKAAEEEFRHLLDHVNEVRSKMASLENEWRTAAVSDAKREEEGYALWDQEETTLSQLIMEYGAADFLYVVPQEFANLKLNMHSSIPIPRESWSRVLEIILAQNGIGVKQVNPYTRQLFILKQDVGAVQTMASRPEHLRLIPENTRLFYVFSPPPEQLKSVFQFFERFADAKQTFLYQVGGKIAIVSSKEEIEKMLGLYSTVWQNQGKVSRVVPVAKMGAKEMEKILAALFGESVEKGRAPFGKAEQDGLTMFSLGQGNALILVGEQDTVERAEKLIKETEDQLQDPCEMTVYSYACRHSDPVDLSKVLEKVYTSLLSAGVVNSKELEASYSSVGGPLKAPDGYAVSPPLVVSPPPLKPGFSATAELETGSEHFIPDPKTGTLLMVVRRDALGRLKELLQRLDVPKKMVQIEVLLFEKKLTNQNSFGLNLLKLGSDKNNINYKGANAPSGKGVFQFFFNKAKQKNFPAFDLTYSFLMTQEDVRLNAAPSIITVNQTPATISIVEEISINNGAAPVDTNKGTTFEKAYSRAQYGITIILTPTVHPPDREGEGDGKGFVTLDTNITFDTTTNKSDRDDRPNVDRRHIENQVRVVDGQTVILGGLRKKASQDELNAVPFLGEIPGIGKLFGTTSLTDMNTEMFFFITPRIVLDPKEELDQLRTEELQKRPGDMPEFLARVIEARRKERRRYFANTMKLFFEDRNVY